MSVTSLGAGATSATPSATPFAVADDVAAIDAWWRAVNYLAVAQFHLTANPLLRQPLVAEHVRPARWAIGDRARGSRSCTPTPRRWSGGPPGT